MKYMLMMHVPHGKTGEYQISSWSPEDLKAHIDHMHALNKDLIAAGEFVRGEGLLPPSDARIVRVGTNGQPVVTDGPFPESKEFLAGFWIVEVDSRERAHQIAARASSAPGAGGKPLIIPIEVRQVGQAPE